MFAAAQPIQLNVSGPTKEQCLELARTYHSDDPWVAIRAVTDSPEQFLRLFITAHGMAPVGLWPTHTYAELQDSRTGRYHFFLIPIQRHLSTGRKRPSIRFVDGFLHVDAIRTGIYPQSIPYTTPFWYFHYNPNKKNRPFESMTLNLSPSCPEKCTLCAGAKTGRVNNGMEETLEPGAVLNRIFRQHPEAASQLDSVAIVTGCFDDFNHLSKHMRDVKTAVESSARPSTYRILEHNVNTNERLDVAVRDLGYEVFVTLECFDQNSRNIALNGKFGRKGRDSREFIEMLHVYARYLEAHPELGKSLVRVTYLIGIDSLAVTESLFKELAEINSTLQGVKIVPWLSVFTPYNSAMRLIQQRDFDLGFILRAKSLAEKYFGAEFMATESGGTADGYARGLF